MSQEGQESCEAAETSSEEDEERKLLLRINRDLVKDREQLPVSAF